jgi:hypothetical protein
MDRDFAVLMLKAIALSLGLHMTGLLLDAVHASDAVTVSVKGLYMLGMTVFVVVHVTSDVKTIIRNVRLRRQIHSAR